MFTLAHPQGTLPKNNLDYALRIEMAGGTGSGFLTGDDLRLYLVTARHVLFQDTLARLLRSETAKVIGREAELRYELSVDLGALLRDGLIRTDRVHDVAVVCLGKFKPSDPSMTMFERRYVKRNDNGKASTTSVPWRALRRYDDVKIGNDVYVFGYPTSIGLRQIKQLDYDRPLVQKGIVAGLCPTERTIVLNLAVNFGNSGGPAVEVEQTEDPAILKYVPIGVVTEYVPMEETLSNVTRKWVYTTITSSPYSIAEPLDPVIDIIQSWK
jgi:hypothetical protein